MADEAKLKNLIKACRETDINDPALSDLWDSLVQELGTEEETMKFLNSSSDKDLDILSPIFEDLSHKFQSKEFVKFLKQLEKKYPGANLKTDVEFAESALD
jgi:hypothetical protein